MIPFPGDRIEYLSIYLGELDESTEVTTSPFFYHVILDELRVDDRGMVQVRKQRGLARKGYQKAVAKEKERAITLQDRPPIKNDHHHLFRRDQEVVSTDLPPAGF